MTLVVHGLQMVGRGVLRLYASDAAYHGGVLLAIALMTLTVALSVVQHVPQAAPADAPEVRWEIDPDWWP
jgi:hypothetical protein